MSHKSFVFRMGRIDEKTYIYVCYKEKKTIHCLFLLITLFWNSQPNKRGNTLHCTCMAYFWWHQMMGTSKTRQIWPVINSFMQEKKWRWVKLTLIQSAKWRTLTPTLTGTAGMTVMLSLPTSPGKFTPDPFKKHFFLTIFSSEGVHWLHGQERMWLGVDFTISRCWRLRYKNCPSAVSLS